MKIKEPKEEETEDEKCNKEFPEKEDEDKDEKKSVDDKEEDEDKTINRAKAKKKKKVDEEDDENVEKADDEEENETKKGEEGGSNPEEENATAAGSGTSPNFGVPSTQNVFVPSSNIHDARNASTGSSAGQSPSQVSYSGKSAKADLLKSPLFTELSGQMTELQTAFEKKIAAVEKSVTDRLTNLQKTQEKIEKFYSQPMYKAVSENVGPEGVQKDSISQQIEKGKVRYSD